MSGSYTADAFVDDVASLTSTLVEGRGREALDRVIAKAASDFRSETARAAANVVEQALAVIALGGEVTEEIAARRIVLGLESGRFAIAEGEAADGGFALSRLLGRSPTREDIDAITREALKYARGIVAWHDAARAQAVAS